MTPTPPGVVLPVPPDRAVWVLGHKPGVARAWPKMARLEPGGAVPAWAAYWCGEGATAWAKIAR